MDHAIDELLSLIPAIFESDEYQARRRTAVEDVNEEQEHAFEALNEKARTQHFALLRTPVGFTFAPIADGGVMKPEDFNALPERNARQSRTRSKPCRKNSPSCSNACPAGNATAARK